MSTTHSERLRGLLEPLAAKAGLDLEEVRVTSAGKRRQLLVVVDSDEGVQLDAVAELSRAVSEALDASDAMGDGEYLLEVSSPGLDRPLTEPRHFRRNEGRLVKFTLSAGGDLVARMLAVDEDGIDLEIPGVKGRRPKPGRIAFSEITRARIEIEFNRKDLEDGAADTAGGTAAETDDGDESTEEA
jgi:ribosome maturation factor RimP